MEDHSAAIDDIFADAISATPASPKVSSSTGIAQAKPAAAGPAAPANDQFDVFEELERELADLEDIPGVTSPSLSSSTAAPLALQFHSPSTKTELGIDDQLDALLASPSGPSLTSTARPQLAVPSAAAVSFASSSAAAASAGDVTVPGARASTAAAPPPWAAATPGPEPHTPARSTATSARSAPVNPLEVAQSTVAMPLPPALAPKALTSPTAWPADKLVQLEKALGGSSSSSSSSGSGGGEGSGTPPDAAAVANLCIQHRTIPPRHRAAVWTALLAGLSGPAAAPSSSRVEQASASGEVTGVLGEATHAAEAQWEDATALQQRICKDISKILSAGGGGGGSEPGLSLSAESLSRVVQSVCTTRMVQYHVHLAALAAPLGYVTADPSTAFILLYNIMQTLFPAYFSSLPGNAALSASSSDPHEGQQSTSSRPAQAEAVQLGKALHALVQYHEPELALALDAACEGWWRPVGSGNGAVPPAWFHSLFSGSAGIRPTALLALWDRLILAAYVSARQSKAQGGSAASPSLDAQAWPLSPVGHAVVACAASLVIRESVGLRVVCRTVGVGSSATSAAADTSGLSVKERIKQQEAAAAGSKGGGEAGGAAHAGGHAGAGLPTAGPEQARALMSNSLDAALKKVLKPAAASGGSAAGKKKEGKSVGGEEGSAETGEEDVYVNSAHTWLTSASSLLSSTPQSFGVHAGVDEGAPTADPTAPGGCGALLLSPAEILPQLVYGWQRVLSAVGAVPPSVRTAALQPNTRAALIPTPTLPIRPVHVMVLDVRPCSHRVAGRLATAYHLDPASLHLPTDTLPALVAAQGGKEAVERIEDEAAGASGVSVLGSPAGNHSGGGGLDSTGGADSSSVARSIASVTGDESHASAWGVRGVPLATALTELKSLNGRLHFVVCGVGARTIRGAYPPTQLAACAALDDARVACAVRALAGAGFKWVSVLEGGFGAIHGGVRNKAMHAPPLLPALRPDGSYTSALTAGLPPAASPPSSMTPSKGPQEGEAAAAAAGVEGSAVPAPAPAPAPASDVYDISLFVPVESAVSSLKACLVDHAPRACPACRHAAVVKLFDKMMTLSVPQGAPGAAGAGGGGSGGGSGRHGEGIFSSLWTGAGGARTAPANLQDVAKAAATLFDGLADSAAAAVQRLQADFGVEPVTLQLPALRVPGSLHIHAQSEAGPALGAPTPAGASTEEGSTGENSSSASSSLPPAIAGIGANVALMGSGVGAATDAALTSILAAVRSGGVTAREGLATLAKDIAAAAERARLARSQGSGPSGTDSKTATEAGGAGETQASSPKQGVSRDVATTFDSGLASSPGTGGGGDAFGIDGEDDDDDEDDEDAAVGRGDRPAADAAATKEADGAGKRTGVQRVKELRDQAAATAEQHVDKMMGQLEKGKEAAAVQAARAREQANKTKDQALAAAQTAKSVISRALAPPPASNPSAAPATMLLPSTAGGFACSPSPSSAAAQQQGATTAQATTSSAPAAAVSSALASVFAGIVTAPPPSSSAVAVVQPATVAARASNSDSTAPRFGLGNFGALAGGFSSLTGKAAEGLKQVTAAAEAGVAMAQAKAAAVAATATAASTAPAASAAPAPAPAPAKAAPAPALVSLPSMDPTSARLLAGTAKGEELDPTDVRWASTSPSGPHGGGESGLLLWKCSKEKAEGGEDDAGLPSAARLLPRTLVLAPTAGRLLVCELCDMGPGSMYRVKSNHHVMELGKLSYSKKTPNRITLWYRRASSESSAAASASETTAGPAPPGVTLVPRVYILDGAQARADGSIVPNGEAFAMALQATVAKIKSG